MAKLSKSMGFLSCRSRCDALSFPLSTIVVDPAARGRALSELCTTRQWEFSSRWETHVGHLTGVSMLQSSLELLEEDLREGAQYIVDHGVSDGDFSKARADAAMSFEDYIKLGRDHERIVHDMSMGIDESGRTREDMESSIRVSQSDGDWLGRPKRESPDDEGAIARDIWSGLMKAATDTATELFESFTGGKSQTEGPNGKRKID